MNKPKEKSIGVSASIRVQIKEYFQCQKNMIEVSNLHEIIITEVEKALVEETLVYTQGNKAKAARILGINRNTMHKKCKAIK